MVVLGLDPASHKFGWAVVRKVNEGEKGTHRVIASGVLNLKDNGKYASIYTSIRCIIEAHKPIAVGIEKPFIHAKHRLDTIMPLCQARGVAIAACQSMELEPFDLMPSVVKGKITGRGNADKELVARFVKMRTGYMASSDDESDAIAVGMTLYEFEGDFTKKPSKRQIVVSMNRRNSRRGAR